MGSFSRLSISVFIGGLIASHALASGCVYKITGPQGGTLYLGGSWHLLRRVDYPLPAAYNRAFDAASRLSFEIAPNDMESMSKGLAHAGEYPRGDNLKSHVDPRTYDYLKRFFALTNLPEEKFSRYRPWFLAMSLRDGNNNEFLGRLGIESFFGRRAQANGKKVTGLESAREHMEVFSGLSDRAGEALLLISLMPADKSSPDFSRMINAWRQGDIDFLANAVYAAYRDFPAMANRLVADRNRKWIPELEQYLRSGQTYFVIVGAAHLGRSEGVISLLKARGYQVQQI